MAVRLIAGGQQGTELAALDFAKNNNIEYWGFVSREGNGRDSLNTILKRYPALRPTKTSCESARLLFNIAEADAILNIKPKDCVSEIAEMCSDMARELDKPIFNLPMFKKEIVADIQYWLNKSYLNKRTKDYTLSLGITGPSERENPGIYWRVYNYLENIYDGLGTI